MNSFAIDLMMARSLVMQALHLTRTQADLWLMQHAGLLIAGEGVHEVIRGNKRTLEILAKLAGPHGYTLVKALEAKK